jgi:hypothetical protein
MRFIICIFVFLCAFSSACYAETPDEVIQKASQAGLAQTLQWRKLLHFEPQGLFGRLSSQVDSPGFFLATNGSTDRQSELEADIRSFWATADKPEADRTRCRFPARYQFIKDSLASQIHQWPDGPCPRYQKFFEALRGVSVSLIFSSYYLNNPSSAFGHTFIRINKAPAKDGSRYELLDYGVNYAANVDTGNALLYAFKGLFGFFPGTFTSVPYYYKVRQYNNAESRDLWEYELNVTPAEVDRLVAHMWELGPAWINYWYLTENCSYHMLTVLEAAAPRLDLTSKLKKWVIPADTIHVVWDTPGLVKGFYFRPSIRTVLFTRFQDLNQSERKAMLAVVQERKFSDDFSRRPAAEQVKILDTAIDFMDYSFASEVQSPGPQTDFKNQLLSRRSQIDLVSPKLVIPPKTADMPHLSNGSRRLGIGYVDDDKDADFWNFELRFALHDQLDYPVGYPEYAAISFGDLNLSYMPSPKINDRKMDLESFKIFEIISQSPESVLSKALSWQIKVSLEKIKDQNCYDCHAGLLGGGIGSTFQLMDSPLLTFFGGLKGQIYYTPYGPTSARWVPGAGPAATLRWRASDHWVMLAEAWYRKDAFVDVSTYQEYSLGTQWSPNKDWGLRLSAVDQDFDRHAQMDFFYYY